MAVVMSVVDFYLEKENQDYLKYNREKLKVAITWWIQDLIDDGTGPNPPNPDPQDPAHEYITDVIVELGTDWSEFASVTDGISDYIAA